MVEIREVRETDDFEVIYELIDRTVKWFSGTERMSFGGYNGSAEFLKKSYCGPDASEEGFIALDRDKIVAFTGVSFANVTKNAYVTTGFIPE